LSQVLLTDCNGNVIIQGELSFTSSDDVTEDWIPEPDRWLEPEIDEMEMMLERAIEWMQET
jgi:hypothetical protein